jgi:glycosyltransferase involved in cell wall biosynthesis
MAPGLHLIFVGAIEDQALFSCMFETWRGRGCSLEILSEMSERDYRNARGFLGRAWMRFRINIVFPLRVALRVIRRRGAQRRVLMLTSTPFTIPAVASLLKRRGDTLCQMLYDLYPDALVVAGKVGPGSLPAAVIGRIVAIGMRRCDVTVFPGERLRTYADKTYGPCPRSVVIPIGTDVGALRSDRTRPQEGDRKVVYVGNFGHLHDYETLSEMLRSGLPAGVQIVFHASGAGYERLKGASNEWPEETRSRVVFAGSLPRLEWVRVMQEADVGLVLFKGGAERAAFPSKTFSAMAAGQAILAVAPASSDLADVVRLNDCGWISEPGDTCSLRRHFEAIAADRAGLTRKQEAAAEAARRDYDVARLAERWMALFGNISSPEAATRSR